MLAVVRMVRRHADGFGEGLKCGGVGVVGRFRFRPLRLSLSPDGEAVGKWGGVKYEHDPWGSSVRWALSGDQRSMEFRGVCGQFVPVSVMQLRAGRWLSQFMPSADRGAPAQAGPDYTILTTSTLPTLMVSRPSVSTLWPLTAMLVGLLIAAALRALRFLRVAT